MDNQKVSGRNMKYVMALFLIGSSLVGASKLSGLDSLISMAVAVVAMIPIIFLYNAILRLYPGKNLYDIVVIVFGNIAGKILCVVFWFYTVLLGALILNLFGEFVHITTLDNTPKIVITSVMLLLCIYIVYCGLANIGNLAKFIFPITMILILITLVSANVWDFDNLKPYFNSSASDFFNNTFTQFALPFGELSVFMTLFSSVDPKENYTKIFVSGILIALVVFLVINTRNILILGEAGQKFPFVSYEAGRIIRVGDFFNRIEIVIGINSMAFGFIKTAVNMFSSSIGTAKILNIKEYKFTAVPTALIILVLSAVLFKNFDDAMAFIPFYKYFAVLFEVLFPIVVLIAGIIKKKPFPKKEDKNLEEAAEDY